MNKPEDFVPYDWQGDAKRSAFYLSSPSEKEINKREDKRRGRKGNERERLIEAQKAETFSMLKYARRIPRE